MILKLLDLLVAIPKIADLVMSIVSQVVGWYMQRQTAQTLSAIIDAAVLQAHAETEEDRYAASEAWRVALSRPRYIP